MHSFDATTITTFLAVILDSCPFFTHRPAILTGLVAPQV